MAKGSFEKGGGINRPSSDNSKRDVGKMISEINELAKLNNEEPLDTEEEALLRETFAMSDAEIRQEIADTAGESAEVVLGRLEQRLKASLSDFRAKDKQRLKSHIIKGDKE